MGKLTWTRYGLMLFAGLAGYACSQEAREPVEVGTAQVELRSDLVIPESPRASTLPEGNPNQSGQSENPMPDAQRRAQLKEFTPVVREDSTTRESFVREGTIHTSSWTFADKHWVRGGKGFGVAAKDMAPLGTVHLENSSNYFAAVSLKPRSKMSESPAPVPRSFKSQKHLVFHSGATGFAHELPEDDMSAEHSPVFENRPALSPIKGTQVSSNPQSQVTQASAKYRLDLMNGNQNLNRHRFQLYENRRSTGASWTSAQ